MEEWMDGWMDGRMDGWMNEWMDGWMDGYGGKEVYIMANLQEKDHFEDQHVV
jgi:hypothetical protein